jgi:hypothetical protein
VCPRLGVRVDLADREKINGYTDKTDELLEKAESRQELVLQNPRRGLAPEEVIDVPVALRIIDTRLHDIMQ